MGLSLGGIIGGIEHFFGGGGSTVPTPGAIRPPTTSPINTGPQTPTGTLPIGSSGTSGFSQDQQNQLQNAFSAAGIWDTVKNLGGDVWNVIGGLLPKNADGSIDWGGALKDVGSWVKDNKDTILQGLSAYNNYERSQKSDQYAKQALDLATKTYDAKQPLRDAGMAGMLNPSANAPNLSSLRTQGQNGLSIAAPTPMPLATGNLANAQALTNGPRSGNPFTKTLPVAPPPPAPPSVPGIPNATTLPLAPMRAAPSRALY